MRPVRLFAIVVALALAVVSATAQPIISAKSGVIAGVEGKVLLNNEAVEQSVTHFPDMKENSVLKTEEGRAEVLLPPGFVLRLGENSSIKMLTNRLVDTRVELLTGSAILEVDEVQQDTNVTIVAKNATVALTKVGVYRFDTEPARLRVFHGTASVQMGGQTVLVATGKMLSLTGDSATAQKFDPEDTDSLDHWSRRRAEGMALANLSAAKQVNDYTGTLGRSMWAYNRYLGLYTFIPMNGSRYNPFYDFRFWSPAMVYQSFYAPRPVINSGGFGNGGFANSYPSMSGSSTGTSSAVSVSPSVSSAPAMSSSSTTSAAAASSSVGSGSAAGGGRGK